MTLALYARRKQWPLQGVTVRLSHSRIHAADCADCETKEGQIDRIEREIALEGALYAPRRVAARDPWYTARRAAGGDQPPASARTFVTIAARPMP
jgi:hypothetical protein